MDITIEIIREDWADTHVPLPSYATAGSVGLDLRANLSKEDREEGYTLEPLERMVVPTGLRVAIPEGYEMQIRPRSGLAITHGVTVINAPGTIDADYRGPLGVILCNMGKKPYNIGHGTRIAQAIVAPVARASYVQVAALSPTPRGAGGFGSTGMA
ncbi:dUTP diphosphatase [Rhodobacterales bacterium HKCCE3408]|nr:dUTP diphosphatase [Rhodobacterales bacterium HKCCE3408]